MGRTTSLSSSRKPRSKSQAGWPWWLWVFVIVGIVASLGRLFAHEGGADDAPRSSGADLGAKATTQTQRFLALAMRLEELTRLASALEASGELAEDDELARRFDKELSAMEAEIDREEGPVARDLLSMVSVVRGTLYQKGYALSDEQVEGLSGNAYTYANPRYWDDYYNKTSSEERFDWYGSWDTAITQTVTDSQGRDDLKEGVVGDLLLPYLHSSNRILMFGCGNSDMPEKMYRAGFQGIVNIDISSTLLDGLRSRLSESMPLMRWEQMNVSSLTYRNDDFDIVLDKGTLDAIEQNRPLLLAAGKEAHRVLRPGGYILSVTFNAAPVRVEQQLREAAEWGKCVSQSFLKVRQLQSRDERNEYYVHACQKPYADA